MNNAASRKHPRVYNKKLNEAEEKSVSLTAATAVGILAFTFVKGLFWGYILKKSMR